MCCIVATAVGKGRDIEVETGRGPGIDQTRLLAKRRRRKARLGRRRSRLRVGSRSIFIIIGGPQVCFAGYFAYTNFKARGY